MGLLERIEEKTYRRQGHKCWPWLGYINKDGEARIWIDKETGSIPVPRALFLAHGRTIPDDLTVLGCPILKDCARPDHHSLATDDEVIERILWKRGKKRREPRVPYTSLPDECIRQIFLSDEPTSTLAKRYNVSLSQIVNIRSSQRHRNITDPLLEARPSHIRDVRIGGEYRAHYSAYGTGNPGRSTRSGPRE